MAARHRRERVRHGRDRPDRLGVWVWLTRPDEGMERPFAMLRQYVLIHGLRLRAVRFWHDLIVIIGLCVIFVLLMWAHVIVYDMPRV